MSHCTEGSLQVYLVGAYWFLKVCVHHLARAVSGRAPHKEHEAGSARASWQAGAHQPCSHLCSRDPVRLPSPSMCDTS